MTVLRLALAMVFVCSTALAETTPSMVVCKDGATSKGGRGACHGHGGVDKSKSAPADTSAAPTPPPAAKAPAATPAPTTHASKPAGATKASTSSSHGKAATDDPQGAIAKCKDGEYWHGAGHSGACSHHGGVASWMDGTQQH
jgi:hypothetical protein